ncbi:MAG: hypothetical protein ACPGGK_08265 [Pikeienuella sp.]
MLVILLFGALSGLLSFVVIRRRLSSIRPSKGLSPNALFFTGLAAIFLILSVSEIPEQGWHFFGTGDGDWGVFLIPRELTLRVVGGAVAGGVIGAWFAGKPPGLMAKLSRFDAGVAFLVVLILTLSIENSTISRMAGRITGFEIASGRVDFADAVNLDGLEFQPLADAGAENSKENAKETYDQFATPVADTFFYRIRREFFLTEYILSEKGRLTRPIDDDVKKEMYKQIKRDLYYLHILPLLKCAQISQFRGSGHDHSSALPIGERLPLLWIEKGKARFDAKRIAEIYQRVARETWKRAQQMSQHPHISEKVSRLCNAMKETLMSFEDLGSDWIPMVDSSLTAISLDAIDQGAAFETVMKNMSADMVKSFAKEVSKVDSPEGVMLFANIYSLAGFHDHGVLLLDNWLNSSDGKKASKFDKISVYRQISTLLNLIKNSENVRNFEYDLDISRKRIELELELLDLDWREVRKNDKRYGLYDGFIAHCEYNEVAQNFFWDFIVHINDSVALMVEKIERNEGSPVDWDGAPEIVRARQLIDFVNKIPLSCLSKKSAALRDLQRMAAIDTEMALLMLEISLADLSTFEQRRIWREKIHEITSRAAHPYRVANEILSSSSINQAEGSPDMLNIARAERGAEIQKLLRRRQLRLRQFLAKLQ